MCGNIPHMSSLTYRKLYNISIIMKKIKKNNLKKRLNLYFTGYLWTILGLNMDKDLIPLIVLSFFQV